MDKLVRTQLVAAPIEEVFRFFSDARNLQELTPKFLRFKILTPSPIEMRVGARIDYALTLFGMPFRWRTHITSWVPGESFVDEQERGPFNVWRHTHEFETRGDLVVIRDTVEYAVPWGPLGRLANMLFVDRTLQRIFDFRQATISRHLEGQ